MRSHVEYLQKGRLFVFKYNSISAEPDRPTKGCHTYKDERFIRFRYSIKPPAKQIGYVGRFA